MVRTQVVVVDIRAVGTKAAIKAVRWHSPCTSLTYIQIGSNTGYGGYGGGSGY